MNLVNNAVLHGFEGRSHGMIVIAALALGDDAVELRVSDDGIGVPPENCTASSIPSSRPSWAPAAAAWAWA